VQIDSVSILFGPGGNDLLPTNVDVGLNYYQISTGFFDPQGEDVVQGATNINVEVLFGDISISHTSIDNDSRLHTLIGQNILDNLNAENADFDSSGLVDGDDFLTWQRGFSIMGTGALSTGDANGDSDVNETDLAIWQAQYGLETSPLSLANILPEPTASVLLLLGTLLLSTGNRALSHRWS
jgi:hypothetical protein